MTVEEFTHQFFQDVRTEADSEGRWVEDVFFDRFCACLTDAGEVHTADRADYRGPRGSGIRVDGYGGDPRDSDGTLNLIILDFDQSGDSKRLTESEMNASFRRLFNFLRRAKDVNWRNALEETSPAFGLADLISQQWQELNRIRMFLLSNRELSERVDGREAESYDGIPVTYSVWDMIRLHRFETVGHGREDIDIDLMSDFGIFLPILPAHLPLDEYEAYLAVVPGQVLAEIYDKWGARLLEQNVRVFLQARSNVNKGIRNTLLNDPSMFMAYNNGITATAEEVTIQDIDSRPALTGLKNLQVVNGGQTTASIHAALRNKADLSRVFVQMKLSIVDPERSEIIVPKISEYANSQNRVNAADFFANHPFHVRMEKFSRRIYAPSPDGTFRETKWFYERARGQYADARSLLTPAQRRKFDLENPRSQLFTKTDLAKFVNVWLQWPHHVSLGAQKNFAYFARHIGKLWEKNETNFNEAWFKEIIAKAIFFKVTGKIVSAQSWYQGGYRANIVAYTISKISHYVATSGGSVDFPAIWKRQSVGDVLEGTIAEVAKQVHDVLVNPPDGIRNVTEWAKKEGCWGRVKELRIEWSDDFRSSLLTKEEVSDARRGARKEQRMINGIEAQTAVVEAGAGFWKEVLAWGETKELLSHKETDMIRGAMKIPQQIPTEAQSKRIFSTVMRLQTEGFPKDFP